MPRLHERITVSTPPDKAFAYLADFSTIEEWDPGVSRSRLRNESSGVGAEYEVIVAYGGREVPMIYRTTEYDEPNRVTFVGEGAALTAVDTIEFVAAVSGTEITYTADLRFRGVMRFLVPFLASRLRKIGRDAVAGMQARLEELSTT